MIDLPEATWVHRRIPKEAFYQNLSLTTAMKDKFVSDLDRIVVENSLTKDSLNLTTDSAINEILLLSVKLKKEPFDGKVIEVIARQNPHKLVFLIEYMDLRQLAIYHRKLYRTPWMSDKELKLSANGFSLDEIWNGMIEQIALQEEQADTGSSLSIEQRLALQEKILKLEKLIEKTEAAAWKEQQPKKKFELYTRVQQYQKKLEELKSSKTLHSVE